MNARPATALQRGRALVGALIVAAATACVAPPAARAHAIEEAMTMQVQSNPYRLADAALAAYRAQDLPAYNLLLATPLPAGTPKETAFAHAAALASVTRVQGLYFLDGGKRIAALLAKAAPGKPALWFEIVRGSGGFVLQGLQATEKDPPLDVEVEG